MKPRIYLLIALSLGLFSASNTLDTRPEKRIALVIGNSNYTDNDLDLTNPVNDAQAMKDALEDMDFEVQIVKNGTKRAIRNALNTFDTKNLNVDKKRYKTIALFYYSGHGMRVNGTNYIIPTNAEIQSPADLEDFAVSSDWIVRRMDAQNNYLSLLMFDACRDNPLTKSMAAYFKKQNPKKSSYHDPSIFSGFDKKEKISTGVIISYAADAGEQADSGDKGGKVSPYVAAYLNHVKTPNLAVETLFRKVGNDVVTQSRNTQHPIITNKFYQDFSFKKATGKDYDGDGIPDDEDACPTKYARTANGCPEIPPPNAKMVYVQGGTFQMGSNDGTDGEKPVHSVTVKSFYMGKYEVTNAEFAKFLNAKGNQEEGGKTWVELDGSYENEKCRIQKNGSQFTVESGYENYPMIYVSWYGARAYCKWLSETTGQTYRLPTEPEWEYAARGGNKSNGYKYSGSNAINDVAWYSNNSDSKTHSVGTKKANELGLYDMSGNVWEWCEDTWHSNYNNAPTNGSAWIDENGTFRVLRGGSWYDISENCRIARRGRTDPNNSIRYNGFRLVVP